MTKKIPIIILLLVIAGLLIVAVQYKVAEQQNVMKGEHQVLLLTADPTENTPGMGAVDMAFIIYLKEGKIVKISPVYPSFMTHPTAPPPEYLRTTEGVQKLYLHDSLWDKDVKKGAKLAQEIVEYNTGVKTDLVVVITPEAVDAMINALGGVYVPGQGYITGNSLELLREEQRAGASRGSAVESLMRSLANAAKDRTKYLILVNTAIDQYRKGNIAVVPEEAFAQFVVSSGLNYVF